jgi:VWFA-related protein
MTRWQRAFTYFFTIGLLAGSLLVFAKSKDKGERSPDMTFSSHTQMVLIPAVVTDKQGQHITGLKLEDFRVMENGAEQKIASFEEISSDTHLWHRPNNPNAFSNAASSGASPGRLTVIVLDYINTAFADQVYARHELLKYLMRTSELREPTALYILSHNGIRVIHDFTADPAILRAALYQVNGDPLPPESGPSTVTATGISSSGSTPEVDVAAVQLEAASLKAMVDSSEMAMQSYEQDIATQVTLSGMESIAQAFRGLPVRKSLIWISSGFPFGLTTETLMPMPGRYSLPEVIGDYERTWQLLNDAQISIYPVDARGLGGSPAADVELSTMNRRLAVTAAPNEQDVIWTFQTFAASTGGRAFFNTNDLDGSFRKAVDDSSQYYMLGYYLGPAKANDSWHRLSVKVDREHVSVRARNGFFITKDAADPAAGRNRDIALALQSPLDYTALPVVVSWESIVPGKEPGMHRAMYNIHLDPDSHLLSGADNNHVALEFIAQVKTPQGKPSGDPNYRKLDGHPTAERMEALRQKGLDAKGGLDLAPGEYSVRFVVRDDLSGRMGSVEAPLKVE